MADFVRIVTSSSAAVGCSAMVASKSALVAFIFTAMPINWIISPASGPTMWQPTTRSERGLVDVDLGQRAARLGLGEADDADLGLGEHRGRHLGVIDLDRLVAEYGVGESMPLADRDRRKRDAVGDVADRIDVRHIGLREFVDRDRALVVQLDAGGF